jgi:O-antigen ligase
MHVWSQVVSVVLALLGLACALRPRTASNPENDALSRLLRFPVFWIGLALLAYVAGQALNPSYRYVASAAYWWLEPSRNVSWLPTAVAAPFAQSNAWRQLMIYASAWMVSCSAWCGLSRRRSWRILLTVLMANAVALSGALLVQRASGEGRLPLFLADFSDRADLTASFVYHNHAGAYLGLLTFAAVALATYGYDQGIKTQKKSTPTSVIALLALLIAAAVLFTLSRGASLTLVAMLGVFGVWAYLRRRFRPVAVGTDGRVTLVLTALFVLFLVYVGRSVDFSSVFTRFDALVRERTKEQSVSSRLEARAAAGALLKDHGLRGVGAGGFRYLFPAYVSKYPDIYEGGRYFWEHAHDDWLEIPIELGVAGDLIVLSIGALALGFLIRRRNLWHAWPVPMAFGCVGTLIHAWGDFPFQCPAILITWCLLATFVVRYIAVESARSARRAEPAPDGAPGAAA